MTPIDWLLRRRARSHDSYGHIVGVGGRGKDHMILTVVMLASSDGERFQSHLTRGERTERIMSSMASASCEKVVIACARHVWSVQSLCISTTRDRRSRGGVELCSAEAVLGEWLVGRSPNFAYWRRSGYAQLGSCPFH